VNLLAVDDDPISRLAISFALKKAFDTPEIAPSGEAALALAEQQTYDVIFLDADMPGMDGYELCTKIRETTRHRTTPVVFVTCHNDFASRAKSTLSGGESLIAKPFLAFEITVKALTLALRSRLQNVAKTHSSGETTIESTEATVTSVAIPAAERASAGTTMSEASQSVTAIPSIPDDFRFPALVEASESPSPELLFTRVPAYLEQLRQQLVAAQQATPNDLQKFLGRLCVGIHEFNAATELAELRAAVTLGSAFEGLFRKLRAHPHLCSPSALNAASAALELLESLCSQAATRLDLTRSTVRILVVDDDPIARRAISGSIQLVFGRPDNAENGEAAIALADEKPFDLILLDVLMPGVDGFAVCRRIHRTPLNQETPVVFITSHDDARTRAQALMSGGCGLIPKPVLASQITLTALTFILRARFNKLQSPTPAPEAAACLVEA
jgi:CheY-like chemotaxis protein